MTQASRTPGFLLLEDGTLFRGELVGDNAAPLAVAEVVFTTNMSGYQEVFTDPSYQGQIVVMTAPMIGNYGVNESDPESARPRGTPANKSGATGRGRGAARASVCHSQGRRKSGTAPLDRNLHRESRVDARAVMRY